MNDFTTEFGDTELTNSEDKKLGPPEERWIKKHFCFLVEEHDFKYDGYSNK